MLRWAWWLVGILLVVAAGAGYAWWRAPRHGGIVVITGRLPEPYVLRGGAFLRVARRDPECIAFPVQNPIRRAESFAVEFERRDGDRYRARIDLREAKLGGSCGWRIEQLGLGVYPSAHLSVGADAFDLISPSAREPGDDRPWWSRGATTVHCTRSPKRFRCADAVDAVYDIPTEGHLELDIEVEEVADEPDAGVPE